jgi:hypothetical protein
MPLFVPGGDIEIHASNPQLPIFESHVTESPKARSGVSPRLVLSGERKGGANGFLPDGMAYTGGIGGTVRIFTTFTDA